MGFTTPTPVQQQTIPAAFSGSDVLATAQTGTGKTGAFGIPLLTLLTESPQRQALILAPTRELAAQIFKVLGQMGRGLQHKGVLVIGGESFGRQADGLSSDWAYVVATPGRLNDHLEQRTVSLQHCDTLVLDEVDRMLDMGFLPQLKKILQHVSDQRQTLLFSATLPTEITRLAASFLKDPVRVTIGEVSRPAGQVKEETIRTTDAGKNTVLLKEMQERKGLILVFARTKSRTDRLAKMLHKEGHDVVALHGGRSQSQRKYALEKFRSGSHRIMVATDLAGRGIDVADIEHVINYDVPSTREDYIHRIGRTGRCGKTGNALNLLLGGDADGERVITGLKPAGRVASVGKRRAWGRR